MNLKLLFLFTLLTVCVVAHNSHNEQRAIRRNYRKTDDSSHSASSEEKGNVNAEPHADYTNGQTNTSKWGKHHNRYGFRHRGNKHGPGEESNNNEQDLVNHHHGKHKHHHHTSESSEEKNISTGKSKYAWHKGGLRWHKGGNRNEETEHNLGGNNENHDTNRRHHHHHHERRPHHHHHHHHQDSSTTPDYETTPSDAGIENNFDVRANIADDNNPVAE